MHIHRRLQNFSPPSCRSKRSNHIPSSYCRTSTVASRSIACHFHAKSGFLLTVPRIFLGHEEENDEAQTFGTRGLPSGGGIRPSGGQFQLAKGHANGYRKTEDQRGKH